MRHHIGPFGGLVGFRSPPVGTSVSVVRPSSSITLLSGRVVTQRAPASSRSWRMTIPKAAGDDVRHLLALEKGTYGPPPWWLYLPAVARSNMLPPAAGTPGLGGDLTRLDGDVEAGVPVLVDGGRHVWTVTGVFVAPAEAGVADPLPVLPGRTYTASFFGAGGVTLRWVDAEGVALSGDGASGSGRTWVTAVAPVGAAGVLVEVAADGTVAALQLNEGGLRSWTPGEGMPRVVISGLEQVYQLATATEQRRDVTVELVEQGGGGRDDTLAMHYTFGGFEA
jgi:hypothetical protein